jgi:hypothetical protein
VALALALIAVLQYRYRLQYWIVLLLLFHFSLIFLTNGVLFPPSYMPDQSLYLNMAQQVRGAEVAAARASSRFGVDLAGYFFGYFPLPVIDSVFSIAIINFILYLFLFIFLREKGMLEGPSLWVFLLYPSLLLYTSVSLRDTYILFFMILGTWLYVRGKVLWSIIAQLPLALLKLQNLGIFGMSLAVFLIIAIFFPRTARRRVPFVVAIVFLGAVVAALPFAIKYGLQGLNLYRHLFWLEEMNLPKFSPVNPATQIGSVSQLLLETVRSIPYMLLKPLPWEADNPLQLLQSIENLVVAALVVLVIWRAARSRATTPAMRFLLVLFIVSLAVYGLTVWNFGTAVRYRFPYVTVFLVFYPRLAALEAERRKFSAEAPRQSFAPLPG